jgi:archaetidylinositol phosphate synthase
VRLRIQANIVAVQERILLNWACSKMPRAVTPNHMSAVGVSGALLVLAGYAATWFAPGFLWLASLGLVLHWFGDSMDGSLARWRATERPRFGYFFDHSIDALGNAVIMLGLGCSVYVRMDVAMAALAGYLLMTIHVLLKKQAENVFQLSFLALGPTELRLGLIILNIIMWIGGPIAIERAGRDVSIYDVPIFAFAVAVGLVYVVVTVRTSARLSKEDPPPPPGRLPSGHGERAP